MSTPPNFHPFNVRESHLTCEPFSKIYSRGFRGYIKPFEYGFPVILLQLIMLFFLSRAIHALLKPFKQTTFVCNILAGIVMGPTLLGRIPGYRKKIIEGSETKILHIVSSVGVMYYFFLISVKMDISTILKTSGRKAWSIGILSLLVPLVVTTGLLYLPGKNLNIEDGFISMFGITFVLSSSAFPQVAYLLDEINLLSSELGHIAMSSAVIGDIFRFLILLGDLIVRRKSILTKSITVASMGLAVVLIIYVLRPMIMWVIRNTPEGKQVKEKYIIGIILGALFLGYVGQISIKSSAIGPMILGLIIPNGPPLGSTLVQKTRMMASEILLPTLFVVIGFDTDVSSIKDWELAKRCLIFVVLVFGLKFVAVMVPALIHKMSFRNALLLGAIMNTRGIIEAGAFSQWKNRMKQPIKDQNHAALLLLVTAATAIIAPLVSILYKPHGRGQRSASRYWRTIQATLGGGQFRIILCVEKEESVQSLITLIEASNPSKESPINAYAIHLIELVGGDAPLFIPHRKNSNLGNSNKSDHIMEAFSNYSKHTRGRVAIMPFTLIAAFKNMVDYIYRVALENSVPLVIIPFHKNEGVVDDDAQVGGGSALKILNTAVLENSPCTVGILVNGGLNDHLRYTHFSYRVAIVFLGGPDDREALTYASRMSSHPNVSVTLKRIIVLDNESAGGAGLFEGRVERQLDEEVINGFRQKNINNECAMIHEEAVQSLVHVINVIRSLENSYDLVMVGRRRGRTHKSLDDEMAPWNENPELGVFGDVLVSPDVLGSTISVLVMQHFEEIDA